MQTQSFIVGKDASQLACRASALGEFFERLSCNYFWNHYYLGREYAEGNSRAFVFTRRSNGFNLVDFNSGNQERGTCAIPYVRERDDKTAFFPVNVIGNLYVSNGMSAGNTAPEARSQIYACIKTLQQARALLNRELRFFGEPSPRLSLEGCDMHQRLLAAYGKLHAQAAT